MKHFFLDYTPRKIYTFVSRITRVIVMLDEVIERERRQTQPGKAAHQGNTLGRREPQSVA